MAVASVAQAEAPDAWRAEWPDTNFSQASVDLDSIISGGPPKDGIPAINDPVFATVGDAAIELDDSEPVVAYVHGDSGRAYPLRILMFHEIVNDVVDDRPTIVTYCPLCNTSIVFDGMIDGQAYDFGTTGKLRHSDLVMYDRQTESWWQQFNGEAIVGEMTGTQLTILPSRVVPYGVFRETFPDGLVMLPPRAGRYGTNPYVGYDTSAWPFLFDGEHDSPLAPLDYVLAVDDQGWSLDLLRREGRVVADGLVIEWRPGMVSALDQRWIPQSRDIGHVSVTDEEGAPVAHVLTFAFAFAAFYPDGVLHH